MTSVADQANPRGGKSGGAASTAPESSALSAAGSRPWYRLRAGRDSATVIGLAAAFGLLALAMVLGGSLRAFIDLPALLIVLGGTAAVTTISFSLAEIGRTQRVIATALVTGSRKPNQTALELLELADHARRYGALALEDRLPD